MKQIDDVEFGIILPKYDNSGYKIDPQYIRNIAHKMSERFGGVTIFPSVLGCWVDDDTGNLVCEENVMMWSIRDTEQVKSEGKDLEDVLEQDRRFMTDLGREAGIMFGQAWITETQGKKEIEFLKGRKKRELPKRMLYHVTEDVFRKLI